MKDVGKKKPKQQQQQNNGWRRAKQTDARETILVGYLVRMNLVALYDLKR